MVWLANFRCYNGTWLHGCVGYGVPLRRVSLRDVDGLGVLVSFNAAESGEFPPCLIQEAVVIGKYLFAEKVEVSGHFLTEFFKRRLGVFLGVVVLLGMNDWEVKHGCKQDEADISFHGIVD